MLASPGADRRFDASLEALVAGQAPRGGPGADLVVRNGRLIEP